LFVAKSLLDCASPYYRLKGEIPINLAISERRNNLLLVELMGLIEHMEPMENFELISLNKFD
jgi:hypothetical protein